MSTQPSRDMMTTLARHNLDSSINALFDAQNNLEDEEGRSGAALTDIVRELNEAKELDRARCGALAQTIDAIWQRMTRSTRALHTAQQQFNVDVIRVLEK